MHLEGDGPSARQPAPTTDSAPPAGANHLQVNPDNVIELAKTFRDCRDRLDQELLGLREDLLLKGVWLEEPTSKWARERFDKYFVHSENSYVSVIKSQREQYDATFRALVETAKQYGMTDELSAAKLIDAGATE